MVVGLFAFTTMMVDARRLLPLLLNYMRRNTLQVHEQLWRRCFASQILVSLMMKEKMEVGSGFVSADQWCVRIFSPPPTWLQMRGRTSAVVVVAEAL